MKMRWIFNDPLWKLFQKQKSQNKAEEKYKHENTLYYETEII